jgi:hypothetical protein
MSDRTNPYVEEQRNESEGAEPERRTMTRDEVREHAEEITAKLGSALDAGFKREIDAVVGEGMWTGDVDPMTSMRLDEAIQDVVACLIMNGVKLAEDEDDEAPEPPEVIEAHGVAYVRAEDDVMMTVEDDEDGDEWSDEDDVRKRAFGILTAGFPEVEHYHTGGGVMVVRVPVIGDAFIYVTSARDFDGTSNGYAVGLYRNWDDEGDVSVAPDDRALVKLVREGSAKLARLAAPERHAVDVLNATGDIEATIVDQGDAGPAVEVLIGNGHSRVLVTRPADYYLIGAYCRTAGGDLLAGSVAIESTDEGMIAAVRDGIARLV